ncbi:hypothetical protein D3C81_1823800 [compost metagenome]
MPRGRVPAIGRTVTRPSSTRTSTSGELPTTWKSPKLKKYMYGVGLMVRSARYRSMGAAANGIDMRWEITTCMQSPARMYSLMARTACSKSSWLKLERNSGSLPGGAFRSTPRRGVIG